MRDAVLRARYGPRCVLWAAPGHALVGPALVSCLLLCCPILYGAAAEGGMPDYDLFVQRVRPFLTRTCSSIDCHGGEEAGKLHLTVTGGRPTDKVLRQDYESVLRYVELGDPMKSPLVLKPLAMSDGGTKHGWKKFLKRRSKGVILLSAWIRGQKWKAEARPPKAADSGKSKRPKRGKTKKPEPASGPVANAGVDRTVTVGTVVRLDGRGSRGKDLTYRWRLAVRPDGSEASLIGATTATPSLRPDQRGQYGVNLQVFEGDRPSKPSRIRIFAKPKGGGAIEFEAERGELKAPMDEIDDPDASNTKAIGIPARGNVGGSATWRFEVPEAGRYQLFAAVKNPGTAMTALTVRVDREKPIPWRVGQCKAGAAQPARRGSLQPAGDASKHVWRVLKGRWQVRDGTYQVSADAPGASLASLTPVPVGIGLVEVEAQVARGKEAGAYIVFDYRGEGRTKFAGIHVSAEQAVIGPNVGPATRRRVPLNLGHKYQLRLCLRKGPGALCLAQLFVDDKLLVERLYEEAFVGRVGLMAQGQVAFDRFRISRGGKVVREDLFDQAGGGAAATLEPIEWLLGEGVHRLTIEPCVKGVLLDRLMLRKVTR